jgi:hypothetical protein
MTGTNLRHGPDKVGQTQFHAPLLLKIKDSVDYVKRDVEI